MGFALGLRFLDSHIVTLDIIKGVFSDIADFVRVIEESILVLVDKTFTATVRLVTNEIVVVVVDLEPCRVNFFFSHNFLFLQR